MNKPAILVTGASGQLGKELQLLSGSFQEFSFFFLSKEELSIDDQEAVVNFFALHRPAYCINCAAYTAVDRAETDSETAFRVNRDGAGILASVCLQFNCKLIHISTDYVFSGNSTAPYKETDLTGPGNTYGVSKLEGEILCMKNNPGSIIIRTAWVYSSFGTNFVRTMIKLMNERTSVNVVSDQVGTPTCAEDLASVCMHIISGGRWLPGIYHYTNDGAASWYDFAVAIKQITSSACSVNPIPSSAYPSVAARPLFSLLDTRKIKNTFALDIPGWQESLHQYLYKRNININH